MLCDISFSFIVKCYRIFFLLYIIIGIHVKSVSCTNCQGLINLCDEFRNDLLDQRGAEPLAGWWFIVVTIRSLL